LRGAHLLLDRPLPGVDLASKRSAFEAEAILGDELPAKAGRSAHPGSSGTRLAALDRHRARELAIRFEVDLAGQTQPDGVATISV
jgi:hypothetical protein